jgi:hypothetical protein
VWLDSGKTVRAELKRTDYPVRKAGGRNRQGSRGSGEKKMRKEGKKKEGKKTYTRRYPCHGEVRRRGRRGGVKRRGLTALARSARGDHIAGVRRRPIGKRVDYLKASHPFGILNSFIPRCLHVYAISGSEISPLSPTLVFACTACLSIPIPS